MKLMDIYKQIENPLDDSNVMKRLIEACGYDLKQPMTHAVKNLIPGVTIGVEEYENMAKPWIVNGLDIDDLKVVRFNRAKNSFVSNVEEIIKNFSTDGVNFARKFANKLNGLPDAEKFQDISNLRDQVILGEDSEFVKFVDAIFFNQIVINIDGRGTFFTSIVDDFDFLKDNYVNSNLKHRLYLNVYDNFAATTLIDLFTKKCSERKIPYNLKTFLEPNRNDNIVIYSINETLIDYIEILREIRKERPDVFYFINEPPVLTGKIDGVIGYASEIGHDTSYNGIFNKGMQVEFEPLLRKWIQNNLDIKITSGDNRETIPLNKYIAILVTKYICDDYHITLRQNWLSLNDGTKVRNDYVEHMYIDNEFYKNVYNVILLNIDDLINEYLEEKLNVKTNEISFDYRGKSSGVIGHGIYDYVRHAFASVAKYVPSFVSEFKSKINEGAMRKGFDSSKICFHENVLQSMKGYDEQLSNVSNDASTNNYVNAGEHGNITVNTIPDSLETNYTPRHLRH